jgi:hypothetical protein
MQCEVVAAALARQSSHLLGRLFDWSEASAPKLHPGHGVTAPRPPPAAPQLPSLSLLTLTLSTRGQAIFDTVLAEQQRRVPAVLVVNKVDLAPSEHTPLPEAVRARFSAGVVRASAASREGLRDIEAAVVGTVASGEATAEGAVWVGSQRQVEALQLASRALTRLRVRRGTPGPTAAWRWRRWRESGTLGSLGKAPVYKPSRTPPRCTGPSRRFSCPSCGWAASESGGGAAARLLCC